MQARMIQGLERQVCQRIAERADDLVALLQTLIRFDTTTHVPGAPARQEAALQALSRRSAATRRRIGRRLRARPGAHRRTPDDPCGLYLRWTSAARCALPWHRRGPRPAAQRPRGRRRRRTPRRAGITRPSAAVVAEGTVRGRGACDMKGGVACMVFAAEVLAELGVRLAGDLLVNTVTEEESTGAGGLVSARTLTADGAIVPEPSGLDVWPACRGSLLAVITVDGRAGHAGVPPGDPDDGGAVNAIEKMAIVLEAIGRLREHWALRHRHRYLSAARLRSHDGARRRMDRLLSRHLRARMPSSNTSPSRPMPPAGARRSSRSSWPGSSEPPPPTRGSPHILRGSGGGSEGFRPPRSTEDDPIVRVALEAARSIGRGLRSAGWTIGMTARCSRSRAGSPPSASGPGSLSHAHTSPSTCRSAISSPARRRSP